MFGRQWFSSSSQYGLRAAALKFDQFLRNNDFQSAYKLLSLSSNDNQIYWERRLSQLKMVLNRKRQHNSDVIISFHDFWPDFEESDNQLLDLFRLSFPDKNFTGTSDSSKAIISIVSCYGCNKPPIQTPDSSVRVLFLGENIRPHYSDYDYSFTSDIWSYGQRNLYLPLWYLELDFASNGKKYSDRSPDSIRHFTTSDIHDYSSRFPAAVYIGNNAEPFREALMHMLEESGIPVHRYGSQSNPVDNKDALLRKYKLTICPENSISDGYITEKPLHSYLSGTVSIYRCGPNPGPLEFKDSNMYIMPEGDHLGQLHRICETAKNVLSATSVISKPLFTKDGINKFSKNLISSIKYSFSWVI